MGLVTEMRLPSAAAHDRNVFSYAGKHRYAVTLFTHASRPVFENAELVRTVLDVLGDSGREQMFEITAYCFVPKKLMLIIGGREETSDFRAFIRTFRTGSAARVRELMKGVLWSRRYQERVVRRGRTSGQSCANSLRFRCVKASRSHRSTISTRGRLSV